MTESIALLFIGYYKTELKPINTWIKYLSKDAHPFLIIIYVCVKINIH